MYGMLKIKVAVQTISNRRLVQVYAKQCTREVADGLVAEFKMLNPGLTEAIAEITWQAEREWL